MGTLNGILKKVIQNLEVSKMMTHDLLMSFKAMLPKVWFANGGTSELVKIWGAGPRHMCFHTEACLGIPSHLGGM